LPEISSSKYLVAAGWDDVPHLDEKTKRELLASTPPHLRKARSQGIPSLGAGAIYPIPEEEVMVDDFLLPKHFLRGYAMDVGWKRTAALAGAWDRDNDIIYAYRNYYRGEAEPTIHATGIRAFGKWMTGAIDPASRGRQQGDGLQMFMLYQRAGLNLVFANNEVEAGIYDVWERLSTGRLKIFRSLQAFWAEYRIYRRDEKGKIVKENDHLMDCLRYLVRTPAVFQPLPADPDAIAAMRARGASTAIDPGMGY
jgi:hypothetical protein